MLPMKFTRRWEWENTWLVFSFSAYLLLPWLIAWLTLPHLLAIFAATSEWTLLFVAQAHRNYLVAMPCPSFRRPELPLHRAIAENNKQCRNPLPVWPMPLPRLANQPRTDFAVGKHINPPPTRSLFRGPDYSECRRRSCLKSGLHVNQLGIIRVRQGTAEAHLGAESAEFGPCAGAGFSNALCLEARSAST